MINTPFVLVAINIVCLGLTLLTGLEFHEIAAIIALQTSVVGCVFAMFALVDIHNFINSLKETKKEIEEDNAD